MSAGTVRIVRQNFESGLLELRRAVSAAEFVTLHADFSQPLPPTPSASKIEERLPVLKKSLEKTSVVRVEICTVASDGNKTVFEAYVTPRPCAGWDARLVFRSSCLEAVPSFEALSTHGVPYIGHEQACYIRRRVLDNPEDPLAAILGAESIMSSDYASNCMRISDWVLAPFRPSHTIDGSLDDDELMSDTIDIDLKKFGTPEAVGHAILAQFYDYCVFEGLFDKEVLRLRRKNVAPGTRIEPPSRSKVLARMARIDAIAIDSLACLNRILEVIMDAQALPVFLLDGEATLTVLHRMAGFKPGTVLMEDEGAGVEVTRWMPLAIDLDVACQILDLGTFLQVEGSLGKKGVAGVEQGAGEPAPKKEGCEAFSEVMAGVVVSLRQSGLRLEDLLMAGRCFGE